MQMNSGVSPPINLRIDAGLPGLKGEATTPFRGHDLTDPELVRSNQSLMGWQQVPLNWFKLTVLRTSMIPQRKGKPLKRDPPFNLGRLTSYHISTISSLRPFLILLTWWYTQGILIILMGRYIMQRWCYGNHPFQKPYFFEQLPMTQKHPKAMS